MRRVRACAAPERWLGSGAGGRKVGDGSRRTPRSHARATACSVTGCGRVVCSDRNGLCSGYRAHVAVTVPVTADLVAHRQRPCPPRLIRSGFGVGGGRAAPSRAAHRMQRSAVQRTACNAVSLRWPGRAQVVPPARCACAPPSQRAATQPSACHAAARARLPGTHARVCVCVCVCACVCVCVCVCACVCA